MKRSAVVVALVWLSTGSSAVFAQDSLEFTLDEVDAAEAPPPKKAAAKAVDVAKVIHEELDGVYWGMSKADLLKVLKAKLRAEFEQRIKIERDIMRQDALYQLANDQYRRLSENYVAFDGQKTGWDVSPVGKEFTHGNREAMLAVAGKNSRDLYFFIQGKLWKWYRELTPEALKASDADEALAVISDPFGKGKPQQERRNESNNAYEGTLWTDGSTRVTALRRGGDVCLIFEEMKTVEQLATLRHNVMPKAGKDRAAAAVDSILLSDAELKARQ